MDQLLLSVSTKPLGALGSVPRDVGRHHGPEKEAWTAIQASGIASDGTDQAATDRTVSGPTVSPNVGEILATAEDASTTETYTVAAVRHGSGKETKLVDLSIGEGATVHSGPETPTGGGILRPAFSRETRSCYAPMPSNVTAVKMSILSQSISGQSQSCQALNGTALAVSQFIAILVVRDDKTAGDLRPRIVTWAGLQLGGNTVEILVTAGDRVSTGACTVTVARARAR